jgi:hypothetical protein
LAEDLKKQKAIWKDRLTPADLDINEKCFLYDERHPTPKATPPKLGPPITANNFGQTFRCHRNNPDPSNKCASKSAKHPVAYYDSGKFEYTCPSGCGNLLLKSEFQAAGDQRWGKCCAYGDVDTQEMRNKYDVII